MTLVKALEALFTSMNIPGMVTGRETPLFDGITLRLEGEEVVSNTGYRAPADHFPRVLGFVEGVRASGTPYVRQRDRTLRLGTFHVNRIDVSGDIEVDCHYIRYPELQRLSVALKERKAGRRGSPTS